jgi:N-acetylglucosaminyldiphosphoundecaprenol N-acetyl-beta-D-mannosaminyltransferase
MSGPDTISRQHVVIDGLAIDNVTMKEAIAIVDEHIEQSRGLLVATPNVDHLLRLRRDAEFREAYARAGLILADGVPLVWLARLQGTPLKAKVSGADFLVEFCRVAASKGRRIFFLGGREGVAQRTADVLASRFPGLIVAGTHSPSWGFDSREDESREIIQRVKAQRPDILFVAAGTPRQEKWLLRYAADLDPTVCVGVGAAFDFVSGRVRRAPRLMREVGLEWFWRLIHEPRRLFYRYVIEDFPFFMQLLWKTLVRRRKGANSTAAPR